MDVVYFLTNKKNGKRYIGSTEHYKTRLERHWRELENGTHHCKPLQDDFTCKDDFEVSAVVVNNRDEAYALEDELLKALRDKEPGIYNVGVSARGGDNLTHNPRKEEIISQIKLALKVTLNKMSSDEKRLKYGRNGESNGMFGKTHTDETKQFLSFINIGKIPSNKGIPLTNEQYDKLMSHVKARDYFGDKNPFHGKKHKEESKEKMRSANLGKIPVNVRGVSVEGVSYYSLNEASRVLKIPVPTILWRVKSNNPKFQQWFFDDLNAQRLSREASTLK